MKNTYIIRKVAYHYSDEYLYVHTLGNIESTFENEEDAKRELIRLEREALEKIELNDVEQLSPCSNTYHKEALAFKHFYKQKIGEDIVKISEYGNAFCERDVRISKDLSDEDILTIRRMLNLKFYELTEYTSKPVFYGVWINRDNKFLEYLGEPYFFNSYTEGIKEARKRLSYQLSESNSPKGTLSELSNHPVLLKGFINNVRGIEYNEEEKELNIKYGIKPDELIGLNELLKEKVFEIREIPISRIEHINQWHFEEM